MGPPSGMKTAICQHTKLSFTMIEQLMTGYGENKLPEVVISRGRSSAVVSLGLYRNMIPLQFVK